jgi:hypothetical protein
MNTYHWKVNAVSVCGSDHEKVGGSCQDTHYFRILKKELLICAVADGAGSALYGDVGAKIASETSVKNILYKAEKITDWQELLIDSFKTAIHAIEEKSEKLNISLREFATTLILVMASPNFVISAQIGDGAVIINESEDNLVALTRTKISEYINETDFIVLPNALDTIQIESWQGFPKNLAIISDGLQMLSLKMPEGIPYAPFFMPLFRFMSNTKSKNAEEQLESFLRSDRIRERATDDLTLFLATLEEKKAIK